MTGSGQLVVALAEPLQAHRDTDAFFRRLEDDEGRGLAAAQLPHQIVGHLDLGDAAVRQAAHEAGLADIGLVDLEPEAGGDQHAERREHAHQAALLVGGLQDDDGQADIRPVLGGHALDQGALLALRAGRGIAANLPVAVHRFDGALRVRGGGHAMTEAATATAMREPQTDCTHGQVPGGPGQAARSPNRRSPRGPFIRLPTCCGNRVKNGAWRPRMGGNSAGISVPSATVAGAAASRRKVGHEAHCEWG